MTKNEKKDVGEKNGGFKIVLTIFGEFEKIISPGKQNLIVIALLAIVVLVSLLTDKTPVTDPGKTSSGKNDVSQERPVDKLEKKKSEKEKKIGSNDGQESPTDGGQKGDHHKPPVQKEPKKQRTDDPVIFKNPTQVGPKNQTKKGIPHKNTTSGTADKNKPLEYPKYNLTMIRIPEGGSLPEYWMAKTETTNQQFVAFLNDSKSGHAGWVETKAESPTSHIKKDGNGNYSVEAGYEPHPVTHVSWDGAKKYCAWLSQKTGDAFDLPTEKQWGNAAYWREGRLATFPWGDEPPDEARAKFDGDNTVPVDSKKYSAGTSLYGLLHMAGNVWEWCLDEYRPVTYSTNTDPTVTDISGINYRVRMGGGFNSTAPYLRRSQRGKDIQNKFYSNVGFRVCLNGTAGNATKQGK